MKITKKVFTSFDVQFTPQNKVKTKEEKNRSSRPQMSCFQCSAYNFQIYLSYIYFRSFFIFIRLFGGGASFFIPPSKYASTQVVLCVAICDVNCYWYIYPPITRKRQSAVRARLGVASHLSTTLRWGNPV